MHLTATMVCKQKRSPPEYFPHGLDGEGGRDSFSARQYVTLLFRVRRPASPSLARPHRSPARRPALPRADLRASPPSRAPICACPEARGGGARWTGGEEAWRTPRMAPCRRRCGNWDGQRCRRFVVPPVRYEVEVDAISSEKLAFVLGAVFTVGPRRIDGGDKPDGDGDPPEEVLLLPLADDVTGGGEPGQGGHGSRRQGALALYGQRPSYPIASPLVASRI
ncbi:uncharacterized protein LOC112892928 [Panicum hallii]|uniref:uncharacterized protein LOC112892928 n=1 Tax=Panicum hallii TaxID=206008 RepID=UPI000DF4D4B1|nr:uncharacterized protein LOC112892928 [Panicum hallii]